MQCMFKPKPLLLTTNRHEHSGESECYDSCLNRISPCALPNWICTAHTPAQFRTSPATAQCSKEGPVRPHRTMNIRDYDAYRRGRLQRGRICGFYVYAIDNHSAYSSPSVFLSQDPDFSPSSFFVQQSPCRAHEIGYCLDKEALEASCCLFADRLV